jgi:hypothetical protein
LVLVLEGQSQILSPFNNPDKLVDKNCSWPGKLILSRDWRAVYISLRGRASMALALNFDQMDLSGLDADVQIKFLEPSDHRELGIRLAREIWHLYIL